MHKRLLSGRVHSYGDKEANVEEKGVLGLWVYEYLFFGCSRWKRRLGWVIIKMRRFQFLFKRGCWGVSMNLHEGLMRRAG